MYVYLPKPICVEALRFFQIHFEIRQNLPVLRQTKTSEATRATPEAHRELCRVMRYRKVNEKSMLVRKGMPASCLYVLISGKANTYTSEPRPRRWSPRP